MTATYGCHIPNAGMLTQDEAKAVVESAEAKIQLGAQLGAKARLLITAPANAIEAAQVKLAGIPSLAPPMWATDIGSIIEMAIKGATEQELFIAEKALKAEVVDAIVALPKGMVQHAWTFEADAVLKTVAEKGLAERAVINISDIVTLQSNVGRAKVASMIAGAEAPLPRVILKDGKYYLFDGNHRVTALKLLGQKTVEVELLDLDALKLLGAEVKVGAANAIIPGALDPVQLAKSKLAALPPYKLPFGTPTTYGGDIASIIKIPIEGAFGPALDKLTYAAETALRKEAATLLDVKAFSGKTAEAWGPAGAAKAAVVNINDIVTLQSTVTRSKVASMIAGAEAPLPRVILSEGKHYLFDGNHRVTALKLLGQTTVKVQVLDLDALRLLKAEGNAIAGTKAIPLNSKLLSEEQRLAKQGKAYAVMDHMNALPAIELDAIGKEALAGYTSSDYGQLNALLRGQNPNLTKVDAAKYSKWISALDNAMAKAIPLDKDIVTYRSMVGTDMFGSHGALLGSEITDAGFVSTSASYDTAFQWSNLFSGNSTMLEIRIPAGARGVWVPSAPIAQFAKVDAEAEFLLPRGAKFKVVKVERDHLKNLHMTVEYAPATPVITEIMVAAPAAANVLVEKSMAAQVLGPQAAKAAEIEAEKLAKFKAGKKGAAAKFAAKQAAAKKGIALTEAELDAIALQAKANALVDAGLMNEATVVMQQKAAVQALVDKDFLAKIAAKEKLAAEKALAQKLAIKAADAKAAAEAEELHKAFKEQDSSAAKFKAGKKIAAVKHAAKKAAAAQGIELTPEKLAQVLKQKASAELVMTGKTAEEVAGLKTVAPVFGKPVASLKLGAEAQTFVQKFAETFEVPGVFKNQPGGAWHAPIEATIKPGKLLATYTDKEGYRIRITAGDATAAEVSIMDPTGQKIAAGKWFGVRHEVFGLSPEQWMALSKEERAAYEVTRLGTSVSESLKARFMALKKIEAATGAEAQAAKAAEQAAKQAATEAANAAKKLAAQEKKLAEDQVYQRALKDGRARPLPVDTTLFSTATKNAADADFVEVKRRLDTTHKMALPVQAEKSAVGSYVGSGYQHINAVLRDYKPMLSGMGDSAAASARAQIHHIDSAMLKAPALTKRMTVWRAVRAKEPFGKPEMLWDAVISDKGYVSTSASRQFAANWANVQADDGATLFEIKLPQGTRGMWIPKTGPGWHDHEYEFLLPRNAEFRVTKMVRDANGNAHITMEYVLPHADAAWAKLTADAADPMAGFKAAADKAAADKLEKFKVGKKAAYVKWKAKKDAKKALDLATALAH